MGSLYSDDSISCYDRIEYVYSDLIDEMIERAGRYKREGQTQRWLDLYEQTRQVLSEIPTKLETSLDPHKLMHINQSCPSISEIFAVSNNMLPPPPMHLVEGLVASTVNCNER